MYVARQIRWKSQMRDVCERLVIVLAARPLADSQHSRRPMKIPVGRWRPAEEKTSAR